MSVDALNNPAASWFEGIPTFFRSKYVGPDDLEAGDIAVVGAPFDATNSQGRPGARFGPRGIREASCYFSSYYYALPDYEYVDVDAGKRVRVPVPLRLFDVGDVSGTPTDLQKTTTDISDAVGAVVARGALPITIGGDHYCAYPAFKGAAEAAARKSDKPDEVKVGYLQVDSHSDLIDDFGYGGRLSHATFARRLSEHPNASPHHMAWLGLNGTLMSGEVHEWVGKHEPVMVTSDKLQGPEWETVVQRALARVGECDHVYVSLDIDVVDGAQAPGTTGVVFGGIGAPRFLQLVELIAEIPNLIGIDLCEVAPNLEPQGRTTRLAALALVSFVSKRLFESRPL